MRSNIWVWPYKAGSRSARALARGLDGKVIKRSNSRYRYRCSHTVINWGSTAVPSDIPYTINQPERVAIAANKSSSLSKMTLEFVKTPDFTDTKDTARLWAANGHAVVCRTLLQADSGRGIVLANTVDEVVDAPLYTKYVPKRQEFRVHVFDDVVIDVQRKALRQDVNREHADWRIRNHSNGFVFARGDVEEHANDRLKDLAVAAVDAHGLVFGAVDIVWNELHDIYYALEVNTAPGLEGQTVNKYVNAINQFIQ